jgi:hypothetical protein
MIHRTVVLITVFSAAASAGPAEVSLDNGYRQMYNLQFEEAHARFKQWERLYASDPMGPVSDAAAFLFEELDRLHVLQSEFFVPDQHWVSDQKLEPDLGLKRRFENALEASRELSERKPDDDNSQFASVLRMGLQLRLPGSDCKTLRCLPEGDEIRPRDGGEAARQRSETL